MDDRTAGAELRAPTTRGRAPEGQRLPVLVRIDLDGGLVTPVIRGRLTGTDQQALPPLAVRARTLFPEPDVTVDLHQAHDAEPAAVNLLRGSLDDVQPVTGPVRIAAPVRPGERRPQGFRAGGTP